MTHKTIDVYRKSPSRDIEMGCNDHGLQVLLYDCKEFVVEKLDRNQYEYV
jgi:hypothetical protein